MMNLLVFSVVFVTEKFPDVRSKISRHQEILAVTCGDFWESDKPKSEFDDERLSRCECEVFR